MSGFVSVSSGIAASIYLALYTIFLGFMSYVLVKRGVKTLFTFIFIFCVFRFAGQLCGTVYAKLGPTEVNWLIAYLVLQAEGYFTLILTCFRFTAKAQVDAHGSSWVMQSGPSPRFTWMQAFHYFLIPANAFVIAGGSMTTGIDPAAYASHKHTFDVAKGLRTTGQVCFLLMTVVSIGLNSYVYFKENIRNRTTTSVMIAGPFLIVRGIFGVMSIYIHEMNYYELSNYTSHGVSDKLVIYEYVLATTMEFVAACLLMTRFFAKPYQEEPLVRGEKISGSANSDNSSSSTFAG